MLSILAFYIISITTVQYLLVLAVVLGIFLFTYGRKENKSYVKKILIFTIGNGLAFTVVKWMNGGSVRNVITYSVIAECVFIFIECIILLRVLMSKTTKCNQKELKLFEERKYDLDRIKELLKKVNILGINADWGEGKSYLIEKLCNESEIINQYEIINVNLLSCRLGEVEAILISEIDRVLRRNYIFSSSSQKLKRLLRNNAYGFPFAELIWEDNDTISASIEEIKKDVFKLDKKLMIIFDDIDRVQDVEIVKNMFVISERMASEHITIIYQYEEHNLGMEREFLEKYIPYVVNLTPISYRAIVNGLWDEMDMDSVKFKKEDILKLADGSQIYNYSLPGKITESRSIFLQLGHISIRKVKIFLQEIKAYYETNTAFQTNEKKDILIRTFFIKNFLYDFYEKFEIGKSITDTFKFVDEEKAYSIWELEERNEKLEKDAEEEWKRLLVTKSNQQILALLAFFPYEYDLRFKKEMIHDPYKRREKRANESENYLRKKENNERIDRVIWNIIGNGHSEYTNMETFVRRITQDVLKNTDIEEQKSAWEKFKEDAFNEKLWKDNSTLFRWMGYDYLPIFQAFGVVGANEKQWIKWINFYFEMVSNHGIQVEMVESLNYCDLTKKSILIAVIRGFNECKILGNMNEQKGFSTFLKKYLAAIFYLGYSRSYEFEPYRIDACIDDMNGKITDVIPKMINRIEAEENAAVLSDMKEEYKNIINFLNKCNQIIQSESEVIPNEVRFETSMNTVHEHQEEVERLTKLKNTCPEYFLNELEKSYRNGNLNPGEVHLLTENKN